MVRTALIALPSGRLNSNRALWVYVLAVAGIAMRLPFYARPPTRNGLGVNWLTAGLRTLTQFSYLSMYTLLKQKPWWPATAGAFPCTMPPLLGCAGAVRL